MRHVCDDESASGFFAHFRLLNDARKRRGEIFSPAAGTILQTPAHQDIGTDTAHFIAAVGANAGAVGKDEHGTAVLERGRRAAVGMSAPSTHGWFARDQSSVIVLKLSSKFF